MARWQAAQANMAAASRIAFFWTLKPPGPGRGQKSSDEQNHSLPSADALIIEMVLAMSRVISCRRQASGARTSARGDRALVMA